ncbi:hypothetical protein GGI35DRAFT_488223 [Trichoderma velutinum]
MKINADLWYLIAFFGFIGFLLIVWVVQLVVPILRFFFTKHVRYNLLPWIPITRLQAIAMSIFLLSNVLIPSIFMKSFPTWLVIQKRAALACMTNATILCVGGGGPLFNALNISRRRLILIHVCVAIIATVEAILHSIVVISLNTEQQNHRMMTSGWIAFGLMLGATFLSIPVSQKLFGSLFIWMHRALAGGAAGVILWHVFGTTSQLARILVICSCAWWALAAIFQFIKALFFFHSGRVVKYNYHPDVIKLSVKLTAAVKFYPGCHFVVFEPSDFCRFNLLHSYTALPFYYVPAESRGSVSEITLLIPRPNNNTPTFLKLKNGQKILLSGPYGKMEDLGCYKNVVLATKGVGLAAVLPLALNFALRRDHDIRMRNRWQQIHKNRQTVEKELAISDGSRFESLSQRNAELERERDSLSKTKLYRDKVKRIDLFWSLESNDQMEWAVEQLKALQALDLPNNTFVVWCGYPCPRNGSPPFKLSAFWRCMDPDPSLSFEDNISKRISEERQQLSGNFIVKTSGDKYFRNQIRRAVLKAMEDEVITFGEAEFQPHGPVFKAVPQSGLTAERLNRHQGISSSLENAADIKSSSKT